MFSRYNKSVETDIDDDNLWRTFTDLLSSILLFVLLLLASIGIVNQVEIDKTKKNLQKTMDAFDSTRTEVKRRIGIREKIILDIKKSLKENNLNIEPDPQTGDITFYNSDILFETGSDTINNVFKNNLRDFVPCYLKALLPYTQGKTQYISEIVVEGHTDDQCNVKERCYEINLDLSQNRANRVVKYILGNEFNYIDDDIKRKLKSVITSNGKSYSKMIIDSNGLVNNEKSRRVVFKFRYKDDEFIKQISDILEKK